MFAFGGNALAMNLRRLNFVAQGDAEAVVQRCSLKKVFLEISQHSHENFVIKLLTSGLHSGTGVFL